MNPAEVDREATVEAWKKSFFATGIPPGMEPAAPEDDFSKIQEKWNQFQAAVPLRTRDAFIHSVEETGAVDSLEGVTREWAWYTAAYASLK